MGNTLVHQLPRGGSGRQPQLGADVFRAASAAAAAFFCSGNQPHLTLAVYGRGHAT